MEGEKGESAFKPEWTEEPHKPGGVYLPLDSDKRVAHPKQAPQSVVDLAIVMYGKTHEINSPRTPQCPPYHALYRPNRPRIDFWPLGLDPELQELLPPPLECFHLFPKLPLELRRKIWQHSFPIRFVEVFYDEDVGACTSSCTPPIALFVCSESRREALMSYKLMFSTKRAEATIYFNPHVDEFYLGIGNFSPEPRSVLDLFLALNPNDIRQIKHLTVDSDLANYHETDEDPAFFQVWWSLCYDAMSEDFLFTGLESLTICVVPSSDTLNNSALVNFSSDIILTESTRVPGQFQAWEMQTTGSGFLGDGKLAIVPWTLPLGKAVTWEVSISAWWKDLELKKSSMSSLPLCSLRFVAYFRYWYADHSQKRADFLFSKTYVQSPGCLYNCGFDSTFYKLLALREEDTAGDGWYNYLGEKLSQQYEEEHDVEPEFDLDPISVYLCEEPCACPIKHSREPELYTADDLRSLSLSRALDDTLRHKTALRRRDIHKPE